MSLSVTILGVSSAVPTSSRFTTSQVVNCNHHLYLIDCGEGTQIQLRKYKQKFSDINHIFISHLHGDHFYGLFGLLSSFNLFGRKQDLHIYSFPALQSIIESIFGFSKEKQLYKIVWHFLTNDRPRIILDDKRLTVESVPLVHRVECCAFVFREKEKPLNINKESIAEYSLSISQIVKAKNGEDIVLDNGTTILNHLLTHALLPPESYAFVTDTLYLPEVAGHLKNIGLLYHEATFLESETEEATATKHCTAPQAAKFAQICQPKKLIIGHFSSRYQDLEEHLLQAKSIFPNTVLGNEGETYTV